MEHLKLKTGLIKVTGVERYPYFRRTGRWFWCTEVEWAYRNYDFYIDPGQINSVCDVEYDGVIHKIVHLPNNIHVLPLDQFELLIQS